MVGSAQVRVSDAIRQSLATENQHHRPASVLKQTTVDHLTPARLENWRITGWTLRRKRALTRSPQ